MSPYEALMQIQGINKSDLPSEVQTLIKRIEATRNTVLLNKKTDESGNPVVSESVLQKIKSLDSEIVNKIWDFIEEKQKKEIRNTMPKVQQSENKDSVNKEPEQPFVEKSEIKKEDSKGKIGFFNF